ncbi:class I SAM-dependent methyltransferase [Hydrogenophaga sp.]|uniref:class I SAM-dependent methyltransferase n=1 Tax=Hydrogenophaga sp. TaxID=1904254 RepID=UPI003D11FC70
MADERGQGPSGLAFALAWVRNPRRMGAIAPASRALAQAIAGEVARVGPELLVEVGAGTGAITQALAEVGPPPDRFFVVERDLGLVRHLRERFSSAEVLHACASRLDQLPLPPAASVMLVSSLPLMSMPREEGRHCVRAMLTLLERMPNARLLQYTYAARHMRPFDQLPTGWRWRRVSTVWANLPPATVWSLEPAAHFTQGIH